MVINTVGVEVSEKKYIKKDGTFLFKIDKFVEDGYSNNANPKFKLMFTGNEIITGEDGKPKLGADIYMHTEFYALDDNVKWKVKKLELALKSPEIFDIMDWVGRYAIGTVKMEEYNGKTNARVQDWTYSKQNDKLPPIQEAKQDTNVGSSVADAPAVDIDEDEIPF